MKTLIKSLAALTILISLFFMPPRAIQAQCNPQNVGGCNASGATCWCTPDDRCGYREDIPCGGGVGSAVIGEVDPPAAISDWIARSPTSTFGGIAFLSVIIRLITIVAGIFTMLNFVAAGFVYVTAIGNPSAHEKVRDRLLFGTIGLLLIVAAYSIAGLFGLIFFGDAGFILRPTLMGALDIAEP